MVVRSHGNSGHVFAIHDEVYCAMCLPVHTMEAATTNDDTHVRWTIANSRIFVASMDRAQVEWQGNAIRGAAATTSLKNWRDVESIVVAVINAWLFTYPSVQAQQS